MTVRAAIDPGAPYIAVVRGAVRPGNYTAKAAALAEGVLGRRLGARVLPVDPGALALPPPGTGDGHPGVVRLRALLAEADGVLIVTPEYQGSFSSVVKLTLEHLGWPAGIRDKPVGLVGVAAGRLGAIKSLEHLRSVCAHLGAHVLPEVVSVAGVDRVFDESGACRDDEVARSIDALCRRLADAALARRASASAAAAERRTA